MIQTWSSNASCVSPGSSLSCSVSGSVEMSLPKEVTLTKSNGRFYRAMTFHYVILALVIVPICFAILLALLNPFWFRDSFFNLVENRINRLTRWRDLLKYRIYLGTDPKVWHALKDRA